MIATLATYAGYRGLANLISNGRAQGYTGKDGTFVFIARGSIAGIPTLIWILVVIAGIARLHRHRPQHLRHGRQCDCRPARRHQPQPLRHRVLHRSGRRRRDRRDHAHGAHRFGQPTSGSQGLELQSITAAALGGVAMQGGKGTVSGTILAVLLLGVLQNGLTILNVNSFWQDIAQGFLLVIAVIIQQRRRGIRAIGLP